MKKGAKCAFQLDRAAIDWLLFAGQDKTIVTTKTVGNIAISLRIVTPLVLIKEIAELHFLFSRQARLEFK